MNGLFSIRRSVAALAALGALALGSAGCAPEGPAQPPLAGAALGGSFSLIDQDGRRVTDREFAGRYRLMYFGYTFCPDVCPTDVQVLTAGLRQFEGLHPARAARVQPIFITIDPERDRPAELKAFVSAFHPRLIGLTGKPAEIAAAVKAYGGFAQKRPVDGASGYLMDHSNTVVLYGPEGQPIAIVPIDQGAPAVAAALDRWVR